MAVAAAGLFLSACIEEEMPAPSITWYVDADGDTYGDINDGGTVSTVKPSGYVANNTDCDDDVNTGSAINPAAAEVENGADDNCNGVIDEGFATYYKDMDGDGYGSSTFTHDGKPDDSWVLTDTDCDDRNADIYPTAVERGNLKDDDCDTVVDEGFSYTIHPGPANVSESSVGDFLNFWFFGVSQDFPNHVMTLEVGQNTISGSGRLFTSSNDYDGIGLKLALEYQITDISFDITNVGSGISSVTPGMGSGVTNEPGYQGFSIWPTILPSNGPVSIFSAAYPITGSELYSFTCCGGGGDTNLNDGNFNWIAIFTVSQIPGTCIGNYDCDMHNNAVDNCPLDANNGQEDSDMNGIGDDCEL